MVVNPFEEFIQLTYSILFFTSSSFYCTK